MLLVKETLNVELADPVESFGSVQRLSKHLWTCLATLGCLWKPSVIFKSCRAISENPSHDGRKISSIWVRKSWETIF